MRDGNLRTIFRQKLPEAMWTSIETGGTGRGIPDAHYVFPAGHSGWLEMKVCPANSVGVRPEQAAWAMRYTRQGGRMFFAVRQKCAPGPRRLARDNLWLIHGSGAMELLKQGLELTGGRWLWEGGPARWDWQAIKHALITGH